MKDYKNIDSRMKHRTEKAVVAEGLGYKYISEALLKMSFLGILPTDIGFAFDMSKQAVNTQLRNMGAKTNSPGGRNNYKLTPTQACEIFINPGDRHIIAKRYGISITTVNHIKNQTTWSSTTNQLRG